MATSLSLQQCLDLCLMNSFCLAVDYNLMERACYFHGYTTYCDALVSLNDVSHFKRVPCIAGKSTWLMQHLQPK